MVCMGASLEGVPGGRDAALGDEALRDVARLAEENGHARLGIMGGTFDPVHVGHLACAETARDACGLDKVLFMVAPCPWMKDQRELADARDRAEMCRLAVADNPAFEVSTLEMERQGKTYTSDTLRALRSALPEEVELFFIIGADTLTTLPGWHEWEQLTRLATFVCVARPGREDSERLLSAARAKGFDVRWVDAPLLDISSSDIRRRLCGGKTVRYLVPEGVVEYAKDRGLYEGGEDD